MKIVLATGIYPPQIGGPATYVKQLAAELSAQHDVTVITYGEAEDANVVTVSRSLPILRWFAYAKRLKQIASDADVVYAFSSVSCGVPLILASLKKPKKVLRLGGDFFWERYTDKGGRKSLREWYQTKGMAKTVMSWILKQFDHIVFSTVFQQTIYEDAYAQLPAHSVVQNALTFAGPFQADRQMHNPFRLLFMGRFVHFKNLQSLIAAMVHVQDVTLTFVGEGPLDDVLRKQVDELGLHSRIQFVGPVHGSDKQDIFTHHDALIIPSITEISPNVALEAKASGLPTILTQEHGLSADLVGAAMYVCPLKEVSDIVDAITAYISSPIGNFQGVHTRSWSEVASETTALFATLGAK